MMYMVVTADSYKVIAKGFHTEAGANGWADAHDWGQWEEEGGLMVIPYKKEG